jgi:hypothetical protein
MVVVQPSSGLELSATTANAACFGGFTGSINLTATGGTLPYGYNWGSGIISEDRTDLAAGIYSVTVTDNKGCTAVLSKTITQPAVLSLSTALTPETCPSGTSSSNGAVVLTVAGGTIPMDSYSWTGPGAYTASSKDISGLTGGTYSVLVTDAAHCTATATVIIVTTNGNPVAPATIKH